MWLEVEHDQVATKREVGRREAQLGVSCKAHSVRRREAQLGVSHKARQKQTLAQTHTSIAYRPVKLKPDKCSHACFAS